MQKNNKMQLNILTGMGMFFVGIMACYAFMTYFPNLVSSKSDSTSSYTSSSALYKNITISDEGITTAVNKVYDSVIVVNTYLQGSSYSSGSGFIYKVDGSDTYIITNQHVVSGGDSYTVTYTDGESLQATLVGGDEYSDIAVLKVETKSGYESVLIGDTDSVNTGDTTFAIGAPLGYDYSWTVTRGIISGKERLVEMSLSSSSSSDYVMKVLQTDAAVNSGNSGGPLCNANGQVIGVISAKISASGVEGMGFAIPIETATKMADKIISGETISYPYLGISMLNVSDLKSNMRYFNFQTNLTSGVVVASVEKGSASEKAGLESGDIITKINDTQISNIAFLRYNLYQYNVGDKITLTIDRDGTTKEITVTLSGSSKNV